MSLWINRTIGMFNFIREYDLNYILQCTGNKISQIGCSEPKHWVADNDNEAKS